MSDETSAVLVRVMGDRKSTSPATGGSCSPIFYAGFAIAIVVPCLSSLSLLALFLNAGITFSGNG
ncbi:MAG: hypothetical protein HPY61_07715 [Methanotrichaceae archaeon]|nr:hypothetical protein [Methanotrichaceae archaeon]